MSLLLYLNHKNSELLPLNARYPRKPPWIQMVNRVFPDSKMDPFIYQLNVETIDDILKLPMNTKSFEQMCFERLKYLYSLNKPVYLMWSGGVDSTSVAVTILKYASSEQLARTHILCSFDSINEFPEFWPFILGTFKNKIFTSYDHVEQYTRKGIVITGEHGDQLFGSDILYPLVRVYGEESIVDKWESTMPEVYRNMFDESIDIDSFVNQYANTIKKCPFPIVTSFDWVWWFNFTNKWQLVKYRLLNSKPWINQKQNFSNIYHFYDSPEWQRWSIDNHDKKIQKTMESYKFTAKRYIVDYTKIDNYLSKPKIGSLRNLWMMKELNDAIDSNFNFLTTDQTLEYINHDPISI